jgi:hypothetical protein
MSKETERMIADLIDNAEQFSELDMVPDDCAEQVGVPPPPDEGRPSQARLILQLTREFDLFHAADGTAYADVYNERRRETYAIENLLKYRYFKLMSEPPMPDAVRKAREVLAARAVYALYVDLVDNEWNVVEIMLTHRQDRQHAP